MTDNNSDLQAPLEPRFASSLLEAEVAFNRQRDEVVFRSGVKSVDLLLRSTLCGGTIIGVARLDGEGIVGGGDGGNGDYDLARHVISTALLEVAGLEKAQVRQGKKLKQKEEEKGDRDEGPEIYVIAPPSASTISDIHGLLVKQLVSRGSYPDSSAASDAAIGLLGAVVLMQYFDLVGLAESLAEVTGRIYERSQSSRPTSNAVKGEKTRGNILLIQGLSQSVATTQRRSGLVHACALLASLLRTLTVLKRSHPDLLVLVEVEIGILTIDGGDSRKERRVEAGEVESAFASADGDRLGVLPSGTAGSVLKSGLDVMVMVHDGFGRMGKGKNGGRIVEAVKDDVGEMAGEWTIWAGVG